MLALDQFDPTATRFLSPSVTAMNVSDSSVVSPDTLTARPGLARRPSFSPVGPSREGA